MPLRRADKLKASEVSGRVNERFSVRGAASVANGNAGVSAAVGWRLK